MKILFFKPLNKLKTTFKMNRFLLIISLVNTSFSYGQYAIKSNYLVNTDKNISFIDSCATFWVATYDSIENGFASNVSRDGTVSDGYALKTMLSQTRNAYAMAKAFMITGDTSYIKYARGGLDFMYDHAWDSTHGGWYNEMARNGRILAQNETGTWNNGRKWSFMQHYALLGIASMVEATDNSKDIQALQNGFDVIDNYLWDQREGYVGYYDEADLDWSNPTGKGFTPTVDAITTNALNLYLLYGGEFYKERLKILGDNIIEHMIPAMESFEYGFPENYDSDWNPNLGSTFTFTGHFLKTAWCLARIYLIIPEQKYIDGSTLLLDEVLAKGYDDQYGGCYTNYNGLTGQRYNTNKEWWQMEQMFTAAIMNYYITGNELFLQKADETLSFYMKYFRDKVYGDVFGSTSRTGQALGTSKASYWKAGYHSVELAFYTYLYGNLFIHQKPAELYYYFPATDSARSISLYPLAIEDENLIVTNVLLNDSLFDDYNPITRELSIDSGEGGIFKVTFENIKTSTIISPQFEAPENFVLFQNWPNPFNPSTTIRFNLPSQQDVNLSIYNVLGKEIYTIVNTQLQSGEHNYYWDGFDKNNKKVASGVYFYILKATNYSKIKKMILVK
ncbi:MAG: T9SS C-terminal target domain-containing protein [Calditrichaeota bacterium]|nr:MAG: T9SS C-terminal target domain-containing protein [Calditrichota bacterium]MBL1204760.1 T9SS C-terminal target domain-containing protein [Calditrichota bacterium]NOG44588.1 T9SS type A sorting domain-containing protein [Calditrichota bacterium]